MPPSLSTSLSRRLAIVLAVGLLACGGEAEPPEARSPAAASADASLSSDAPAAPEPSPHRQWDWPAAELRTGGTVTREMAAGDVHVHRLLLPAGDLLRVRVEQERVDVEVTLRDPAGEPVVASDGPHADRGPELVMAVAEDGGGWSLEVRALPSYGPGRYRARIETLGPATADHRLAAAALRTLREAAADPTAHLRDLDQLVTTWERLGEPGLQAETLYTLALGRYLSGDLPAAMAGWEAALPLFRAADELRWQLLARQNMATLHIYQADYEAARRQFLALLDLARETGDAPLEGTQRYHLGKIYQTQGEIQQALAEYERTIELRPVDDFNVRPLALHNLGVLYRLSFEDPERARRLLLEALDLYRPGEVATHPSYQARTRRQLALLAERRGDLEAARRHYGQALAVPGGFDDCGRSTLLASLALLDERAGRRGAADDKMDRARELLDTGSCPRATVTVALVEAERAELGGRPRAALRWAEEATAGATTQGDRSRLADGLAHQARLLAALGRPREALAASHRVLSLHTQARPEVLREDLRQAYFATVQDRFDLHIDLLSGLGQHAAAWSAADQARSPVLRDLLAESGHGLRARADPELLEREARLQRRLTVAEGSRSEGSEPEITALVEDLERVRAEIRRADPLWAELTAPEPLSVETVQRQVLDPDTLLVQIRLGEETSHLWAITDRELTAVELPPRSDIERLAGEADAWIRSLRWPGRMPPPVCELSRVLLEPVAEQLAGHRRLAVVLDGVLETLPFAALALPETPSSPSPPSTPETLEGARVSIDCATARPLVARHEIVQLPSVGALVAQRRLLADREPAAGWLAMIADPVYDRGDPRLGSAAAAGLRPAAFERDPDALRRLPDLRRLRHAGEEARAVLAALPPERVLAARGAAASKALVTGGGTDGHRVVHFATHGIHDPDHPLLSHLVLTEHAADGSALDGSLYAHEIYRLRLDAELVVLSACSTARGRHVRGEGVVAGLPRAFLYAGAPRVLVSLWPVEDRSTRELMVLFYRGLIGGNLPPGEALQGAQEELRRRGHPPHRWAGFVLQGDWRPLPPFVD